MDLRLNDKRVFVAGSSQGIGLAIAEGFLAEGAFVCITGQNEDKLNKSYAKLTDKYGNSKVLCFAGNLLDKTVRQNLREYLLNSWRNIDILVSNIGNGKPMNANPMDLGEWKRMMDINLYSAVGLINDLQGLFTASCSEDKAIVLISSIVALNVMGTSFAYAAAKDSILTLTKYLSREIAQSRIRVNAVVPGNVKFPGGRWEEIENEKPEMVRDMLEREVPLKRFASPEEIADAVLFLASERAGFISGASLVVDGGQTR